MATKGNSKPWQTSMTEVFHEVVTGFRGKLRMLPNIKDGAFCKNSLKLKAVHYFCKILSLDAWKGSEYASEYAFIFKSIWISKVTDNLLLG